MRARPSARVAASIGAALALLGGGAGMAIAQEDGVFVDPDSPAGKEYALPLDSARRDAGWRGRLSALRRSRLCSGRDLARGERAGRSEVKAKAAALRAGQRAAGGSIAGAMGGVDASRAVAQAVAESGSGLSAGALTALIALGVLLVGGAVGLSLRALRGRDQAG